MECWSFLAAAGKLIVRARQAAAWLSASTNHTWPFAEHRKECDVLKLADASKTFPEKKKKSWNTPASVTKGGQDVEEEEEEKHLENLFGEPLKSLLYRCTFRDRHKTNAC